MQRTPLEAAAGRRPRRAIPLPYWLLGVLAVLSVASRLWLML
jgi:hypothetical protein